MIAQKRPELDDKASHRNSSQKLSLIPGGHPLAVHRGPNAGRSEANPNGLLTHYLRTTVIKVVTTEKVTTNKDKSQ
jgi:hypothetical protein